MAETETDSEGRYRRIAKEHPLVTILGTTVVLTVLFLAVLIALGS